MTVCIKRAGGAWPVANFCTLERIGKRGQADPELSRLSPVLRFSLSNMPKFNTSIINIDIEQGKLGQDATKMHFAEYFMSCVNNLIFYTL